MQNILLEAGKASSAASKKLAWSSGVLILLIQTVSVKPIKFPIIGLELSQTHALSALLLMNVYFFYSFISLKNHEKMIANELVEKRKIRKSALPFYSYPSIVTYHGLVKNSPRQTSYDVISRYAFLVGTVGFVSLPIISAVFTIFCNDPGVIEYILLSLSILVLFAALMLMESYIKWLKQ